jgi:protein phosphatase
MPTWTAIALALGLVVAFGLAFGLARPKPKEPSSKPEGASSTKPTAEAPSAEDARKTDPPPSRNTPAPSARKQEEAARASAPPRQTPLPRISEDEDEDAAADLTLITLRPSMPSLAAVSDEDDVEEVPPPSAPAVPIVVDDDAAADEPTRTSPFILVSAAGQTDRGQRRRNNEDSYVVVDEHGLFVVADGMGGYAGGEVASGLAVETIEKAFREQRFEGSPYENVPRRGSELARSIQMANKAVYERAQGDAALKGMGTTVVAARFLLNKQRLYVGHVGDSRCYRMRDGKLEQITTDHTMAQLGFTGPAFANRLNRAVGTSPSVEIDLIIGRPRPDDAYLLCSDGLSKMVPDEEVAEILREAKHPQEAIDKLIARANDKGGLDNITAILVQVRSPTEYFKSLQKAAS